MEKARYVITITPVDNGFAVQVGCMNLVFQQYSELLAELGKYYASPQQVEKEYLTKYRPIEDGVPQQVVRLPAGDLAGPFNTYLPEYEREQTPRAGALAGRSGTYANGPTSTYR